MSPFSSVVVVPGWAFLVANSLHVAEKSGAVRELYNAVRTAGNDALREAGFASYPEACLLYTSDAADE